MTMTLKVYEVDRYGRTTRVLRPKAPVKPLKTVPVREDYPACRCSRCMGGPR